jgi:hypothetical protein
MELDTGGHAGVDVAKVEDVLVKVFIVKVQGRDKRTISLPIPNREEKERFDSVKTKIIGRYFRDCDEICDVTVNTSVCSSHPVHGGWATQSLRTIGVSRCNTWFQLVNGNMSTVGLI